MKLFVILFVGLLTLSACDSAVQKSQITPTASASIRPLTQEERAADFDQLLQLFKTYYGPYQYKEKIFNFSIEKMILETKAQAMNAKTDEEFMGYVMKAGAKFRDGHVQFRIENSASNIFRYKIPVHLAMIEGKAIVAEITKDLAKWSGISQGDEILSVDGKTAVEILALALQYRRGGEELSDQAMVIYTFLRPSYMTDIIPASPKSLVFFKKASGAVSNIEIPWETESYAEGLSKIIRPKQGLNLIAPFVDDFNATVDSHRGQMGQVNPVFLTEKTQAKYNFVKVFPSAASLKKQGLKGNEKAGIFAALYKHNGKTVFLLRSSTYYPFDYTPAVYMKTFAALISEYQELADVMVLDQTYNPGGSFCSDFYNLFANESDIQGVEQARADRKWVNDLYVVWPKEEFEGSASPWDVKLLQSWGAIVEKAYDKGDFLSEPFPLFTGSVYAVRKSVTWTKPMIVLINELAGSCGDIFPMLVKANHRAKLFGQATMGLGGNVEPVGQLNHSRIQVSMTRGLFFPYRANGQYIEKDFVENNGIEPDIPYAHTVEDFRNGYVNYVKTFSDQAVELVK